MALAEAVNGSHAGSVATQRDPGARIAVQFVSLTSVAIARSVASGLTARRPSTNTSPSRISILSPGSPATRFTVHSEVTGCRKTMGSQRFGGRNASAVRSTRTQPPRRGEEPGSWRANWPQLAQTTTPCGTASASQSNRWPHVGHCMATRGPENEGAIDPPSISIQGTNPSRSHAWTSISATTPSTSLPGQGDAPQYGEFRGWVARAISRNRFGHRVADVARLFRASCSHEPRTRSAGYSRWRNRTACRSSSTGLA